jgi:hypothetical protein
MLVTVNGTVLDLEGRWARLRRLLEDERPLRARPFDRLVAIQFAAAGGMMYRRGLAGLEQHHSEPNGYQVIGPLLSFQLRPHP